MMERLAVALAVTVFMSSGNDAVPRVPVLVELFTSEGCSSCPPADRLLSRLAKDQPVAGADVIVLSEHVDYWNSLGWRDPYSSAEFSERQRDYARHLDGQVYTPEVVVDGSHGMIGSEEGTVTAAIRQALRNPKAELKVDVKLANGEATMTVEGAPKGLLYFAAARDLAVTEVKRGENAGQTLRHVSVVYRMVSTKSGTATFKVEPGSLIVAFVAKDKGGQIVAIGKGRA